MKLARNIAWSFAGGAVPTLVALATVPVFVPLVGAERYGVLAIAWLMLGYFGAADFGLGRAVTQRVAAMRDAGPVALARIVWSGLVAMAVPGFLGAAVLLASAWWYFGSVMRIEAGLRAEAMAALWLLALCNPLVGLGGVLGGALAGLERFRPVSTGQILGSSALLVLPLAVALTGRVELAWLIGASLTGRLLGLLPMAWGVWRTFLRGARVSVGREELRQLSGYGAWIMVTALVGPVMVMADRFVIGALIDAAAVAAYAIPFQIAHRTLLIPFAITQALFPRFAAEEGEAARQRCHEFVIFVGVLFAPIIIALICMAGPLLQLWLGASLDPRSVPVAQLLLAGFWANAVSHVPYGYIQARGDPRFTALLHLAELPLYLALLAGLGALFGLAGFAAAFALRCTLDGVALCRRAGAFDRAGATRLALPAALVLLALAFAMEAESLLALAGGAAAGVAMAMAALLLLTPARLREALLALAQQLLAMARLTRR